MAEYCWVCSCKSEITLRTDAEPGVTVWAMCDACGMIQMGLVPGGGKQRKVQDKAALVNDAIFDVFSLMTPG